MARRVVFSFKYEEVSRAMVGLLRGKRLQDSLTLRISKTGYSNMGNWIEAAAKAAGK